MLITMKLSSGTSAGKCEPLALTLEELDYMDQYRGHVLSHLAEIRPDTLWSHRQQLSVFIRRQASASRVRFTMASQPAA